MFYSENFSNTETYEVRHDNNGNCIHVFITDGDAVIYPTLQDLIGHRYGTGMGVERVYLDEEDLPKLYESEFYGYSTLKKIVHQINSTKVSEQK